jgi:PAS domain S-box-containing protein
MKSLRKTKPKKAKSDVPKGGSQRTEARRRLSDASGPFTDWFTSPPDRKAGWRAPRTGGQHFSELGELIERLSETTSQQIGPLGQAVERLDRMLDHLNTVEEEAYLDTKKLARLSKKLSRKLGEQDVTEVICKAAREIAQADGACVIFKEGEFVRYLQESAIGSLWAGRKFPIADCITGWSILNRKTVVIENIYSDERVPIQYYLHTFVKSLAIVPIERENPIGAIGVYWAQKHRPTRRQLDLLERLADLASIATVNVQLIENLKSEIAVRYRAEQALRVSDQWFRAMADTAPVMIWQSGRDKLCYYFNRPWLEFTGRTLADEVGNGWADGIHPDDFKRCLENYESAFDARREFSMEYRLRRHDGEYRWLIDNGVPVFSSTGEFEGYIGSCIDITDRKRTETSLGESQRQLANIIGSAMDAIITVDADERVILFNAAAETMFRCRAAEAIGQRLERFIPQRFRDLYRNQMRRFEEAGIASQTMGAPSSFWGLRSDGEEFPLEASISQVDVDGRKLVTVMLRDITRRRQYEDKLREQAALLDEATDAILVRDLEDRILFWSKGAERAYGWTSGEAVGKHILELYQKETDKEFYQAKQSLIQNGHWSGEVLHVTRDGRKVAVHATWTLLRDRAGNSRSVLVINTDITKEKELEAQFLRSQRMESIGTMASGIAHDINNVLSPILLAIRLLEKKFPGPDSREILEVLKANAERGGDMVRQILDFARGVKGERMALRPEHLIVDVVKVLNETLSKSIEIDTSFPEGSWAVSADPTQIQQVLMNLVINAADAIPTAGTISVEACNVTIDENFARMNIDARVGRYVRISVRDTGTGIPANVIDRIFDPFFTTKEPGKGTGLGLSTALTIVKSHGGFINVYSEEGMGTEFSVYLPAVESTTSEAAEASAPELPLGHGELILVVDDESGVREITRTTLEAYGYKVLTASDGTEAVALFAQNKNDVSLVLTDVVMPYMAGPAAIRAFQKLNPQVAIIVSSGLKTGRNALESDVGGVKAFLPKPYTADTLLNTLAEVLSQSNSPQIPNGSEYEIASEAASQFEDQP